MPDVILLGAHRFWPDETRPRRIVSRGEANG